MGVNEWHVWWFNVVIWSCLVRGLLKIVGQGAFAKVYQVRKKRYFINICYEGYVEGQDYGEEPCWVHESWEGYLDKDRTPICCTT